MANLQGHYGSLNCHQQQPTLVVMCDHNLSWNQDNSLAAKIPQDPILPFQEDLKNVGSNVVMNE
jgi:hypothetical protein